MHIYAFGDHRPPAWPFWHPILCANCGCNYALEPGIDSRSFDVAQIPVENKSIALALMDGTLASPKMRVVAIVLCPECGYPNALDRPEETNDVAGTGEDGDTSAQHGGKLGNGLGDGG